jgi:hypothetical protein
MLWKIVLSGSEYDPARRMAGKRMLAMCDTSSSSVAPSTTVLAPNGGQWVTAAMIVGKPRGWVMVRFAPRPRRRARRM